MKQTRFTREGFEKTKQEYEKLLASRPDAVAHLKKAREMGDLSENGYYKASRAKLSSIDHRLSQLKFYLKQAVIINKPRGNGVSIGSMVSLFDGKKEFNFQIVGDLEANPAERRISLLSPLGKAINGKQKGEEVEFKSPSGLVKYIIRNIK